MSSRVYHPCAVKNPYVSKSSSHEECVPEVFSPSVVSYLSWHDEAHVKRKPWVAFPLEANDDVLLQVGEIHFATCLDDIRVLLYEQPTHVSEEKSASSIVGISRSFRKFVVDSVIAGPVVDTALVGNRVDEHKAQSSNEVSFIRSVRPQSVNSDGDTKSTTNQEEQGEKK